MENESPEIKIEKPIVPNPRETEEEPVQTPNIETAPLADTKENSESPNDKDMENFWKQSNAMNDIITESAKKNSVGPIIGSVIIVVLISLAGLYYWGSVLEKRLQEQEKQKIEQQQNALMSATTTQINVINSADVNASSSNDMDI
jgi:uncharacterized protein HemX